MTEYPNIGEQLDGARIVKHDAERESILAWFGGHGIHAYTYDGREFAFWNVGDFAQNDASEDDVLESIEKMIKTGEYLELY